MWYETWWFAITLLFVVLANLAYILDVVIDLDIEQNAGHKYFVIALHKSTWVRIAKNKELNIVGKVCAEIFISTYCLPAIAILYITGLLASVIGYIGSKLFFKESE